MNITLLLDLRRKQCYQRQSDYIENQMIKQIKKSAQTNASGNTKLSLETNVGAITDSKNSDYYKYDNLIKFNDIKVPSYSSLDLASLQRSDVLRLSKERAIQNGAIDSKDGNSYFVYNNGDKIRINKTGLLHRKYNDKLSLVLFRMNIVDHKLIILRHFFLFDCDHLLFFSII